MNTQQQVLSGGTGAQQDILSKQVTLFLFDLKNEAAEHGFKSDDSWTVQLATDDEMVSLKKHHYPVVSIRLQPNALLNIFQQVKNKLQQSLSKTDAELTESGLIQDEKKHLAAYPAKSMRQ